MREEIKKLMKGKSEDGIYNGLATCGNKLDDTLRRIEWKVENSNPVYGWISNKIKIIPSYGTIMDILEENTEKIGYGTEEMYDSELRLEKREQREYERLKEKYEAK